VWRDRFDSDHEPSPYGPDRSMRVPFATSKPHARNDRAGSRGERGSWPLGISLGRDFRLGPQRAEPPHQLRPDRASPATAPREAHATTFSVFSVGTAARSASGPETAPPGARPIRRRHPGSRSGPSRGTTTVGGYAGYGLACPCPTRCAAVATGSGPPQTRASMKATPLMRRGRCPRPAIRRAARRWS
jgi:hypothetical protein